MTRKTSPPIILVAGDQAYEQLGESERGPRGEQVYFACPAGRPIPIVRIKRLPKLASHKAVSRLREEVELAALLDHSNIERVHGVYEYKASLYVVSEYLSGQPLQVVRVLALACERRHTENFALYIGAEVAAALHHAHESSTDAGGRPLRVVHRDVSPANILLGAQGEVKLGDFGLAHSLLPGRLPTTLSGASGPLCYGSPEQILGLPVDARSDLFSLGLVMTELLTGRQLFSENQQDMGEIVRGMAALSPEALEVFAAALGGQLKQQATLDKVVERHTDLMAQAEGLVPERVEELTEGVPEETRAILRRLLRKDPAERHQTAAELEREMRERLEALGGYDSEQLAEELLIIRCLKSGYTEEAAQIAFRSMRQGGREWAPDTATTPSR